MLILSMPFLAPRTRFGGLSSAIRAVVCLLIIFAAGSPAKAAYALPIGKAFIKTSVGQTANADCACLKCAGLESCCCTHGAPTEGSPCVRSGCKFQLEQISASFCIDFRILTDSASVQSPRLILLPQSPFVFLISPCPHDLTTPPPRP